MRGMSILSDQVAWVSGSNGSVGKTTDGGKTWQWQKPAGYEKLDFRDIEAFDENRALIVNAGAPAYILLTTDGGKTWTERYKNVDSAIFLDGMSFWDNQSGMIFGDPINNKMQLIQTSDAGLTWEDVSGKLKADLKVGEAGFAASGTTIVTQAPGTAWIATGGSVSNIYYTHNRGAKWYVKPLPILQGESSTGP
ncbi:MAG: oxidoreductase, partial [Pedobacter sp.]